MPSTIQIAVSMQNANNFVTESLVDSYVTQYGRHNTSYILNANVWTSFPWPPSGETTVYIKFPPVGQAYTVSIAQDPVTPQPLVVNIPAGPVFVPVILPKPAPAADGLFYTVVKSTYILTALPMFYF